MIVRLGHVLLVVVLLTATGGHWTVLQTVAWTNMLADNLRTASIEEAITKTFDGKHPCKLCQKISAGKRSEKKAEFPASSTKLEFVLDRAVLVFAAPTDFQLLTVFPNRFTTRSEAPPTPPPLAA